MDKLEKALEKARRERGLHVPDSSTSAFQAALEPERRAQTAGPTSTRSATPSITEEVLERHRIVAHHQKSAEADIFRILRTQVLQIMGKSDFKTLAITSPSYGDGKTTLALNLALSIGLDLKQTVLLVDLDLRKPSLHKFLGIEIKTGLTDYIVNNTPIAEGMIRLPFDRISLLPAGKALDNSSEILGSPKMAALAHELKTRYHDRFVIYDMPPVLAQDDSIAFLPHVDATLIVVRDAVTREKDLKLCIERLADTNIIGTVLNDAAHA